jgi:hypothetical protein
VTAGDWVFDATLLIGMLANAWALHRGMRGIDKKMQFNTNTIAELEKNTNSIKDALVKVTGESEYNKGLKQGRDERVEK